MDRLRLGSLGVFRWSRFGFLRFFALSAPKAANRAETLPLAAIPVVQDTQWYRVFTGQAFCERVGTLTGGMEI